jgi:hypothetical protein
MSPPSHADDDADESCWRWHYRVGASRGVMSPPRHVGDDVVESVLAMV